MKYLKKLLIYLTCSNEQKVNKQVSEYELIKERLKSLRDLNMEGDDFFMRFVKRNGYYPEDIYDFIEVSTLSSSN